MFRYIIAIIINYNAYNDSNVAEVEGEDDKRLHIVRIKYPKSSYVRNHPLLLYFIHGKPVNAIYLDYHPSEEVSDFLIFFQALCITRMIKCRLMMRNVE